jgi:cytochrome c
MNNIIIILTISLAFLVGCAQEDGSPSSVPDAAPAAEAAEQAPAGSDLDALLASADIKMGQRQYIVCQACHSTQAGGPNKVGPNLHGFLGRDAAQAGNFVYSAALMDSGIVWDSATLDQWIASPAKLVPGTTMVFAGIRDPEQRANLIAYLQQVTTE